jgi:cyclohexyl-isocyanide hydratase
MMRWLYHVVFRGERHAAAGAEGFVHCSYRDDVVDSARLYFPAAAELEALQIDPRRIDARVEVASTPRGPMPHVFGEVARDAIRAGIELDDIERAPDVVSGARFGFVAFDGMTLLDLVGMHDPISRIRSMGFDPTSTCEIVGANAARVWCADGATLMVDRVRPPLDEFDVLLVAGGLAARTLQRDLDVGTWLATFPKNRLIASVCTGALLVGAAGRLDGKRATTHASALDKLADYGATAVRERVVDEGQVITAGGVTSALDLGLHVVTRLYGAEVAAKIAAQMEHRADSASHAPSK